jgi:GAF domain-containing protein
MCSRTLNEIAASDAPDSSHGLPDPAPPHWSPMAAARWTSYDASFPAIWVEAMKKPSHARGKPAKARPHKAVKREGRAPKALSKRTSSPASQETQVARLTRELNEALERQRATAEVLSAISRSNFELQPILQSVVDTASHLCRADVSVIFRLEGGVYRFAAGYSLDPAYLEHERRTPISPGPGTIVGRAAMSREVVQIEDAWTDPLYEQKAAVKISGGRSMIGVPLMREGQPVGVMGLARTRVDPFAQREIDLVTTFAAQAVIAIENTRLLSDLRESLQEQTATSEVLQVISSSPGDLQPVFEAMLTSAMRICEAKFGHLLLYDGEGYHAAHLHNLPAAYREMWEHGPIRVSPNLALGRLAHTKQVVQITDIRDDSAYYTERDPLRVATVELGGARTLLAVPMLKENQFVGAIVIYRQEVRPFTEKQIALVTNFAAQAVIAIENARLLNELRQRTADLSQRTTDLTEALEQQTATSDVLQVISSSPGDLQPVFEAILEKAVRICDAKFGTINRWDGDALHLVASHNLPPAFAEFRSRTPFRPGSGNPISRMLVTKTVSHIEDLAREQGYLERNASAVAAVELGGVRTHLVVPMLKDNELIGVVIVYRQEVCPFTDKQIELVKNFAAQAVIAIENARLLSELRESLQEQTATAEVLQVISGSPGDLEPVFATMLEKAVRICDATFGNIYRWDGDALQLVATHNTPLAYAEHRRHSPFRADQNNSVARMITSKKVVHLFDAAANDAYLTRSDPTVVAAVELGGIRSALIVPMLKEDELVGAFIVSRQEVRPFSEKQIALVTNFAAQAVIAIENARLLAELRKRTDELGTSLEYQTATSDVLKVISRSVFDLQKILEFVAETAARLCAAKQVGIFLLENQVYRFTVGFGLTPSYREIEEGLTLEPGPETLVGRTALEGEPVHIRDALSDPQYGPKDDIRKANVRTILGVPLTREGKVVGVIALARETVSSFNSEQIELVRTFADQAVIAIENARLLSELKQRTEEVEKLNQHLEQRVTDQVDEIERVGRLRRFLPPQVADLIVASGTEKQLESHRREITALFCDLRGFTGFSESSDPEDVMALLREYHAAIGEIIIRYSGTLERYAGDGVMVVFNDPIPVDNPALQSVQMALEMREAIGALTEKWRQLGHEIGFGIGIAHGYATLGTIGFEGRFDYAAIGTVSNVASRLCDEAKPGQILISPRVLMAVKDAVTVEPVGEFELKGIRRPIAAHNVVAALPPSP